MNTIEQELQAKSTAPRITPADIEANIASEYYFTAEDGACGAEDFAPGPERHPSLALLTFCVLVLRNGFTVTGTSAVASPQNFDADIGKRIAREDAVRQVWPMMGYELRSRLAAQQEPQGWLDRVKQEAEDLSEKLDKLQAFLNSADAGKVGETQLKLMREQYGHMVYYYNALADRIVAATTA